MNFLRGNSKACWEFTNLYIFIRPRIRTLERKEHKTNFKGAQLTLDLRITELFASYLVKPNSFVNNNKWTISMSVYDMHLYCVMAYYHLN